MNETVKNDEKKIMLVEDVKDGKVRAITDVDKDGNIKTVEPTNKNIGDLLNVNTSDSAVEAFFKKFMEQTENPAHTGIFMMAKETLENLVKIDFPPDELEKHRVSPSANQQFQPLDIEKIDRADLARKGIRWEDMEPHLKAMSYGHKSNKLVDMSPELEPGGARVPTKGRVSLEEQPDSSIKVIPHYYQEKPNLNIPVHGILLDEETKANLLKNGNAGKVVELEFAPGKKEPCYLTLDKLTNVLEVLPANQIEAINKIKGVELSEGQQLDIAAGRKVLIEGMTSRSGTLFDGYIQINASDKKFDFTYDGLDRNRYAQENKEIRREKREIAKETNPKTSKDVSQEEIHKQVFIPKKLLGVELNDKQTELLRAGKATYIKGMVKDGQGEPFNAWVRVNPEKNKLNFFKWNPDYAKKQDTEVKPANESKTQVAVNSEGKTNEATKHLKEPLKQGQQKPTDNQQKKQDENKPTRKPAVKKSGLKV
ncbi:DUF3945 domain-containing protein [Bacteroides sp. 224]|uniref:DUF3945 domain-containing protein n=1 Tax=Bacteroides sp. 224 TaxID=2302936 RepID=UPI0013D550F8|nr:DUF3945 domain-containing protein [Bacteroides sp. 224]NDV64639.1 DUF3945 domain-containing protein [Bacteroides sp. 224]